MTTQTDPKANPIANLKPVFVDHVEPGYRANVTLGAESPTASELLTAAEFLTQELSSQVSVAPAITSQGFVLVVSNVSYSRTFDTTMLTAAVQPKYGAHATVAAAMARNSSRVHIGTKVTFRIVRGTVKVTDIAKIEAVAGVQRALWAKRDGFTRLSFSLTDPSLDNVDTVSAAVAEVLGVHVQKPVDVVDPDEDAALYPEFDYRATSAVTQPASAS